MFARHVAVHAGRVRPDGRPEVARPPRDRVVERDPDVQDDDRRRPDRDPGIAVGQRARDPQRGDRDLPAEQVDEVDALIRPGRERDRREGRAADLDREVGDDEQPGSIGEGLADRARHQQAREHDRQRAGPGPAGLGDSQFESQAVMYHA